MTSENSPDPTAVAGDDNAEYIFEYGHGRMPFFMKLAWIAFLAFGTVYIVSYLLTSLAEDLA